MRAWIAAVVLTAARVANAEVFLDDSMIELSAEYTYQPVTFLGQMDQAVGTGVHFEDRNGVFARFVARSLKPPDREADDPYQYSETGKATTYLGGGVYQTTTFIKATLKPGYATPEQREARHREKLAHANEVAGFNDYSTEIRVWEPGLGGDRLASNIKGGAFGMTTSLVRIDRYSLETGVRWEAWHTTDDVCTGANGALPCRYKFFGMPISLLVSLGWLGRIELGYDFNWRSNRREEGLSVVSPIRASLTIDILNRAFVRARAHTTRDDVTNPGFAVEIGGRL